jgi:hypothetical protein
MNSNHVTKSQADQINDALYPPTNYLIRLRDRMRASLSAR